MKLTSYWLDTAPLFSSGAEGPPHGDADVAVVGAGFTGLSAAVALAKKGAKVVVLEAGRVANAASGRNGGMRYAAVMRRATSRASAPWASRLRAASASIARRLSAISRR